MDEIPVRIVQLSDEQALEWQLIENSQRIDVHPYEEAQGSQRLLDLPGYDVATLAEKTGKSDSLIYRRCHFAAALSMLRLMRILSPSICCSGLFQDYLDIRQVKSHYVLRRCSLLFQGD
jgi:hypothetical protein